MPERVNAQFGDSLCSIAVARGLPNCRALRDLAENRPYCDRALEPGDVVLVPDRTSRDDPGRGTEQRHEYEAEGPPLPDIRFVHGSPSDPCSADPSLAVLNVSNYRTHRAGATGTGPFPRETTSAFNANAHADVDSFKVEVFEPRASASQIQVEVRCRRPVFDGTGRITGYTEFDAADRGDRSLTVTCRQVSDEPDRYRSCYLRLVTDEADKNTRSAQALLVTDMADGSQGANDRLEVLDQRVRTEYEISTCPQSVGTYKCHAVEDVPVGEDRLRIRIQAHILRTSPGAGSALVGGRTPQDVRRYILKWIRRTYAQANMSARFETPDVDEMDPLENLISVYNTSTNLTAGGGVLRVSVNTQPAATEVRHTTVAGETPAQIAADIASQINALANFNALAFPNPLAWNNGESCDVMVTRTDGVRVELTGANSTDRRTRLRTGRARPNSSPIPTENYYNIGARGHRVMVRTHALNNDLRPNPAHDLDAVHVFVIHRLSDDFLGWAYIRDADQSATYQATAPMVGTCFVNSSVMANDRFPHVTAHEIGHILGDQEHFPRSFVLMTDQGCRASNHVNDSKRLTDRALNYRRQSRTLPGATARTTINPVHDTRTRESPEFIETWPREWPPRRT